MTTVNGTDSAVDGEVDNKVDADFFDAIRKQLDLESSSILQEAFSHKDGVLRFHSLYTLLSPIDAPLHEYISIIAQCEISKIKDFDCFVKVLRKIAERKRYVDYGFIRMLVRNELWKNKVRRRIKEMKAKKSKKESSVVMSMNDCYNDYIESIREKTNPVILLINENEGAVRLEVCLTYSDRVALMALFESLRLISSRCLYSRESIEEIMAESNNFVVNFRISNHFLCNEEVKTETYAMINDLVNMVNNQQYNNHNLK